MINNIVYFADTTIFHDEKVFNHFYHAVSDYRKEKIDRIRLKGKENSLAVEILLQKALDDFGVPKGLENRAIEIGNQGKPFLKNYPDVFFNLSHAKDRAMCIVSSVPCGCDVEPVNPGRFNLNLARRFFSPQEVLLIENACEEMKSDLFFDFWTRKEAFGKMTGEGVNFIIGKKTDFSDLNAFENQNGCFFKLYGNLGDGYKYCACSRQSVFPEEMKVADFAGLS